MSNEKMNNLGHYTEIAAAYSEGFQDGVGHGNLNYKYPPEYVAWLMSDVRESLGIGMRADQQDLMDRWCNAKFDDRVNNDWTLKEISINKLGD